MPACPPSPPAPLELLLLLLLLALVDVLVASMGSAQLAAKMAAGPAIAAMYRGARRFKRSFFFMRISYVKNQPDA